MGVESNSQKVREEVRREREMGRKKKESRAIVTLVLKKKKAFNAWQAISEPFCRGTKVPWPRRPRRCAASACTALRWKMSG